MKFFAAVVLLLVVVSVSSAKEQNEARAKGHEKASRSALYNGGLSNAHQEKYREWPIPYYTSNADGILTALFQILRILQTIQAELGNQSDDQTYNPPIIESGTTDEPTSFEPIEGTEVSSDDPEVITPEAVDVPPVTEVQPSERSHSNSASRARLAHAHSKSKSNKSPRSKAKSHGKSKNHAKGHSKHAKSHAEKKN